MGTPKPRDMPEHDQANRRAEAGGRLSAEHTHATSVRYNKTAKRLKMNCNLNLMHLKMQTDDTLSSKDNLHITDDIWSAHPKAMEDFLCI